MSINLVLSALAVKQTHVKIMSLLLHDKKKATKFIWEDKHFTGRKFQDELNSQDLLLETLDMVMKNVFS